MRIIQFQHQTVPTPSGFVSPSTLPSLPPRLLQGVTMGTNAESQRDQNKFDFVESVWGSRIHCRDVKRTEGYTDNRAHHSLTVLGAHYVCFVNDVGSEQGVEADNPRLTSLFADNLTKFDSGTTLVTSNSQLLSQMTQFKRTEPGQAPTAAWAVLEALILPSLDTYTVTVHMLWTHAVIGLHNTTAILYCTPSGHTDSEYAYIHDGIQITYIQDVFAPFQVQS